MKKAEFLKSTINYILDTMTLYANNNYVNSFEVEKIGKIKIERDRGNSLYPTQSITINESINEGTYRVSIERFWSPPAKIAQFPGANDNLWKNLDEIKAMLFVVNEEMIKIAENKTKKELLNQKQERKEALENELSELKNAK